MAGMGCDLITADETVRDSLGIPQGADRTKCRGFKRGPRQYLSSLSDWVFSGSSLIRKDLGLHDNIMRTRVVRKQQEPRLPGGPDCFDSGTVQSGVFKQRRNFQMAIPANIVQRVFRIEQGISIGTAFAVERNGRTVFDYCETCNPKPRKSPNDWHLLQQSTGKFRF